MDCGVGWELGRQGEGWGHATLHPRAEAGRGTPFSRCGAPRPACWSGRQMGPWPIPTYV